jgi:hypothetical protein
MLNVVHELPHARRRFSRLLLGGVGAAVLLAACQQAPPPAVKKPRRSFEESGSWRPSSSPRSSPAGGAGTSTDARARQVQQTWEQARQANNDAERQRLANEALEQTQSMAEQPSGHQ